MRTRAPLAALCIALFAASAQGQTVWYVDDDGDSEDGCTSWQDACPELQTALSLAGDGDQIWVAVGTYRPDYDVKTGQHTGDREASLQLINSVALYGGFEGTESTLEDRPGLFDQTILSGDLLDDDGPDLENNDENSYHVTTGSGTDTTAIVDGFTITAGNADGPQDYYGGGMFIEAGSPTVSNCTFTNNSATVNGGGMLNSSSSPTVSNCMFSFNMANTGGGMGNRDNSNPEIAKCAFIGNAANGNSIYHGGGGLRNLSSNPIVTNCSFIGNTGFAGGGMSNGSGVAHSSSPVVTNCIFAGNAVATMGGGMYNRMESNPTVTNCTFYANSTVFGGGGGMSNLISSPTVTNCTFYANLAGGAPGGGGISNSSSGVPTLSNCIVWGNVAPDGSQIFGSPIVTYSDVEGGFSGTGNIDVDPVFVDPDGADDDPNTFDDNDYRLAVGSPCIDAADNTAVPKGVAMDLDGNPRFVDDPDTDDTGFGKPPIVDMGAYEFQLQDPCADDDGDGRVTICHWPPGNFSNARTITISVKALPAHLAHGDSCGPCEDGDG